MLDRRPTRALEHVAITSRALQCCVAYLGAGASSLSSVEARSGGDSRDAERGRRQACSRLMTHDMHVLMSCLARTLPFQPNVNATIVPRTGRS